MTGPLYLIRHAHAGSRSEWDGDDGRRPLSPKGRAQADGIADLLAEWPIKQVYSSPLVRCVETVEPLARVQGLDVVIDRRLAEGASALDAEELMMEASEVPAAFCSHGDVIPKVIRRLLQQGMRTTDPVISQKGSMWIIGVDDDGHVTEGRYQPPLSA